MVSSGNPVNADAVVFTFQRILDPAARAPSRGWLGPVQPAEEADGYTVRFVLNAPYALLLGSLSVAYFGIVDPQAVRERGAEFGRRPVGSGPFVLKEWITGDRIVLAANDRHRTSRTVVENKGKPYLGEIVFLDIPQVETQPAAVQIGEAHMISSLPGEKAALSRDNPEYCLITPPAGTGITYVSFAMQKGAEGQRSAFNPPPSTTCACGAP